MKKSTHRRDERQINHFRKNKTGLFDRLGFSIANRAIFQIFLWGLILFALYKGFDAYMVAAQRKMEQHHAAQVKKEKPVKPNQNSPRQLEKPDEIRPLKPKKTDCQDLQDVIEHWEKNGQNKSRAWTEQRQQEAMDKQKELGCAINEGGQLSLKKDATPQIQVEIGPGQVFKCTTNDQVLYTNGACSKNTQAQRVLAVETGTGIAPPNVKKSDPIVVAHKAQPKNHEPRVLHVPEQSETKAVTCLALEKLIIGLDSQARQRSTERIRQERKEARDKQFRIRC